MVSNTFRVAAPAETSKQDSSLVKVCAFTLSHTSPIFHSLTHLSLICRKKEEAKKRAELQSPLPPPSAEPKPQKRKAITSKFEEEEEEEERPLKKWPRSTSQPISSSSPL